MERRNPVSADTVTRSEVRPAQFTAPAGPPEVIQTPPAQPLPQGRRIRVFPRSDVPVQAAMVPRSARRKSLDRGYRLGREHGGR